MSATFATTKKMTQSDIALAQRMRSAGKSYEAIGEVVGVEATTVSRTLDPGRARRMVEYNQLRRAPRQTKRPEGLKRGHQCPWEGE